MQENVALGAAAQPGGDLGFLARWANIYFSPKKTFEAVKARPFWLAPMVLLVVLHIGFALWTAKPALSDVQEGLKNNERIMAAPPEQREQILEGVERGFKPLRMSISTVIQRTVYYFLVPAILLFLGNIVLGGEAGYKKILGAFVYTDLISIPEKLVLGSLATAKGTMKTALSLAVFFPADKSNTLMYWIVNVFDIFAIWFICVLLIGLGAVYGFKSSKIAMAVLPLWVIAKIIEAAFYKFFLFGG